MKLSEFSILESFDSQVKGRLVRATNDLYTTDAIIGSRKIVFDGQSYKQDDRTIWEIAFTEKSPGKVTTAKTGSGNEMQVFSFVIESINDMVARYHPDEIHFSSHKADENRTKLYKRLITRINLPGYKLAAIDSDSTSDIFRIVKDDTE